jgi:uncharacterized protein (TIGR02001 family)
MLLSLSYFFALDFRIGRLTMSALKMSVLTKGLIVGGLLSLPLLVAGKPVMAEETMAEETSPYSLSANVSLINDYRYRGFSQTFKEPAIQGGIDFSHSSGVYLGTWESNVQESFLNGANIEMDFYGGYDGKINDDLSYNVGGLYYYYPGQNSGTTKINTFELYAGATWKWINVKYSHSTTKFFGLPDSRGSYYLEGNVSVPLPADVGLDLHYGHQNVDGSGNYDWNDWKVGVSKEFGGFGFSLAYVDTDVSKANGTAVRATDGKSKNVADGTILVSVSKSF